MISAKTRENEATARSIAGGFGMTLELHNEGQHWAFVGPTLILDWWPSTGRYMVNKVSNRDRRLREISDVRNMLERLQKHPPAPLPPKKTKRTPDSGREFVPCESLLCVDCRKPGAMPYNQKCDGCSFGGLRFGQ